MKVLIIAFAILTSISVAEWQTDLVDPVEHVYSVSLILDSNNNPHLTYWRGYYEAWTYYAFKLNSTWQVDTIGGAGYGRPCITVDSMNSPHISLSKISGIVKGIRHAYLNGSVWFIETVDDTTTGMSSIMLDSSDNPHIGYRDGFYENLKYAYWDGMEWHIEIVDSNLTEIGSLVSLSLDASEYPHISYTEDSEDNLMYAFWNGSVWNIEAITSCNGGYNSLVIDSNNNSHIAYTVIYSKTDSDLMYAYNDGMSWQIEAVDTLGEVGWCCSIALDSNDYPRISYRDNDNWMLKYACWDGSDWQIETVDGFERLGSSLAISSTDAAHIAYCTSDGVKYAWQIETVIEPEGGSAAFILNPIYPNPTSGSFAVEFEVSEYTIVQSDVFDITGRIVARTESTAFSPGIHQLSYSELSTGFYICRVYFDSYSENRCLIVID